MNKKRRRNNRNSLNGSSVTKSIRLDEIQLSLVEAFFLTIVMKVKFHRHSTGMHLTGINVTFADFLGTTGTREKSARETIG